MKKTIKTKILVRRDSSLNWITNNPILASGEIGFDTDQKKHKIGDGVRRWTQLPFFALETDLEDRITFVIRTREEWETWGRQISQKGVFYIYSDKDILDNQAIPNIKIGDGLAYISDLPFITDNISNILLNHINNSIIHITQEEREFWNNKVTSYINKNDNENIVFDKGTLFLE